MSPFAVYVFHPDAPVIVSLDASLYLSIYASLIMPRKWPSIKTVFLFDNISR